MSNPALTPEPFDPLSAILPGFEPAVATRHGVARALDIAAGFTYYGILAVGAFAPFVGALRALMV